MHLPVSLLLAALLNTQSAPPALSPTGAAPAANEVAAAATQPTTRLTPDRDPWVFRCVLDDNPRMLVISLGDHWWMAFNTVDCRISKIWNGEIELTGAVYDTKHGPQPKAKGRFILGGPLAWAVGPLDQRPAAEWLGYTIQNDNVILNWQQGEVQFSLTPSLITNRIEARITTQSKDRSLPVASVLGPVNGLRVSVQPLSGLDFESAANWMVAMPAEGETLMTIDTREDVMKSRSTEETPK